MNLKYPFYYFGQGFSSFKSSQPHLYIWFKEKVSPAQRKNIEQFLFKNEESVLSLFDPDSLDWGRHQHLNIFISDVGKGEFRDIVKHNSLFGAIKSTKLLDQNDLYGYFQVSQKQLKEEDVRALVFYVLLEKTLRKLHSICAIEFVVQAQYNRKIVLTPWHEWSSQNIIDVANFLISYLKKYGYLKSKDYKRRDNGNLLYLNKGLLDPESMVGDLFELLTIKTIQVLPKETIYKIYELANLIKGFSSGEDKTLIKFVPKLKIVSELDFVKTLSPATLQELRFDIKGLENWEKGEASNMSADWIALKPETIQWLKKK